AWRDRRVVAPSTRDPGRLVRDVVVAPLHQRDNANAELAPFLRQVVLEALGVLAVANPLEDALADEAGQPVGEDGAGHPKAREQLIEAVVAKQDVTEDEQRPAVTHHFERAGYGADLRLVVAPQHRPDSVAVLLASCKSLRVQFLA